MGDRRGPEGSQIINNFPESLQAATWTTSSEMFCCLDRCHYRIIRMLWGSKIHLQSHTNIPFNFHSMDSPPVWWSDAVGSRAIQCTPPSIHNTSYRHRATIRLRWITSFQMRWCRVGSHSVSRRVGVHEHTYSYVIMWLSIYIYKHICICTYAVVHVYNVYYKLYFCIPPYSRADQFLFVI